MPDDPELLTATQAAEYLVVGLTAVSNAAADGRLPYVLVYGRKLFRRADLDEYKERSQPDKVKRVGRPPKLPKTP